MSRRKKGAAVRALQGAGALLTAAAALTACGGGDGATAPGAERSSSAASRPSITARPNPLAGTTLYVDSEGVASRQITTWQRESRRIDAARLQTLARQPVATWLTGVPQDPYQVARDVTTRAARAGRVPLLVLYNLPDRDCGAAYSKGGAANIDDYLAWVGSVAAGIEGRKAVVVLEPDGVAQAIQGCGGKDVAQSRSRMLAQAVQILKRRPGTTVYLDAGHAGWIKDMDGLARSLTSSGIRQADGFSLNVSNFEATRASAAYGTTLSDRLGGTHFVIDTSRNGAGPQPVAKGGKQPSWCNPKGARIGTPPTTSTGQERVDALLWIKQPGNSDGACRPGAPAAGGWWPDYALQLVGP